MTTDESALRKAARENPTDESYRLLLADYLCENGRERDGILERIHAQLDNDDWREQYATWCEQNGDPVRAELIRVQVALDEFRRGSCDVHLHKEYKHRLGIIDGAIRCREHELLAAHADLWRKGPVCEECKGNGISSLEEWKASSGCRIKCSSCYGTGDAGGLMRVVPHPSSGGDITDLIRVDYIRGMKRIHTTLTKCVIVTVPSDWFRSVLTHHPDVLEVWVTDITPSNDKGYFYHGRDIPKCLQTIDLCKLYPTENAARTALARTVIRWGRSFL